MQTSYEAVLDSHPFKVPVQGEVLRACLEACAACELACIACADACLAEEQVASLRACIRLNLDCAAICNVTAATLARQTSPDLVVMRAVLQTCALSCAACGSECRRHASRHPHCAACADACAECAQACRDLIDALPAAS